ncbi:hypothetical protein XELAEV_18038904mg [Xenopus laevis]|uniref:Uncharacterized protein n=1 Tax=Xenopus laevis TaxID=8355 RepID=A0A974C802_XENLA|nr:hypothetical protein XELAEV_18038904mg [Xenopus laevis]
MQHLKTIWLLHLLTGTKYYKQKIVQSVMFSTYVSIFSLLRTSVYLQKSYSCHTILCAKVMLEKSTCN